MLFDFHFSILLLIVSNLLWHRSVLARTFFFTPFNLSKPKPYLTNRERKEREEEEEEEKKDIRSLL